MVEIKLDQKSGTYGCKKVNIKKIKQNGRTLYTHDCEDKYVIKTETYESDLFQKITHKEIGGSSGNTFLKFNSSKLGITWSNFFFSDLNTLDKVEVYFSILKPEIPLIVGVITNTSRYYTGNSLRSKKGNISTGGFFPAINLLDNLIKENNTQNKVITYRIDKTSSDDGSYNGVTVSEEKNPSFDKYTHKPSENTHDENSQDKKAYVLYKGQQIKLSVNNDIQENLKLTKIQKTCYSTINVVYTNKKGLDINTNNPILLQLTECTQSSSSKIYTLPRIDDEALKWTQIPENIETLSSKVDDISEQIKFDNKKSIVVKIINKNNYDIYVIQNNDQGLGDRTESGVQIKVSKKNLTGSRYEYHTHDLSQSAELLEKDDIVGLRIYVENIEIRLYDKYNKKQKIKYDPIRDNEKISIDTTRLQNGQTIDTSKYIYSYFYTNDTVPLILVWNNDPYSSNKTDYFSKWTQIKNLKGLNPDDKDSREQIKNELDKINKEFNEILLHNTKEEGYGIADPPNGQPLSESSTIRVTVKQAPPSHQQKFGKVTHSTTNNSSIGLIKFGQHELHDDAGKTLSQSLTTELPITVYTTVSTYYYKSDFDYIDPLLLGIGTNTGITLYYERFDRNNHPTTKWKRVSEPGSTTLESESVLEIKINKIKYEINQSIKIQLEKDSNTNGGNYNACVIENRDLVTTASSSEGTINVTDDSSSFSGSSNYKCYKHSVNLMETNKPEICWLRFFLYSVEIHIYNSDKTDKTPIFYKQDKKDVYVYFYSGFSGDKQSNKVPLFIRYNDNCFKPVDRDNYFNKWVPHTPKSGFNLSQSDFDEINKNLNQIELTQTTNETYGIPKPVEAPSELTSEFYDRVCLKACFTKNYRRLTHATTNKFGIESIYFHGNKVSGMQIQSNENEVSVYYESCDKKFLNPLLIGVKSQGTSLINSYFYRYSTDGLTWSEETATSKYDRGLKIKNELATIRSKILIYMTIKLEQHSIGYETTVSDGFCNSSKSQDAKITVDTIGTLEIRVINYHTYNHHLITYYGDNKEQIKTTFKQSDNFPLCLRMTIIDRDLDLIGKNGRFITLIYKDDNSEKKHDVEVYYHQDESDPYEIPLLIKFGKKFFGPKDKDSYFSRWEVLNIDTVTRIDYDPKTKVKENLERIYDMVNTIEIFQTSSYGIKCCNTHRYYYNKTNNFSTKRVTVTSFKNEAGYTLYVHKTVNNTKIGLIKGNDDSYNFNQHTEHLSKQTINEVVVIYKVSSSPDKPFLVLLNSSAMYGYSSFTYGYYYNKTGTHDTHTEYEFQKISGGYNIMSFIKGESLDGLLGLSEPSDIKPIQITLENIKSGTMLNTSSTQADEDTSQCKGLIDNSKEVNKCQEDDIAEESTDTGSESSAGDHSEDQDDGPRVGVGGHGHGLGDSGDMVAAAKPEQGAPGQEQHVEQQQQESKVQERHVKQQQQESQVPEVNNGHGTQPQPHGGGGDGGSTDGDGARPDSPQTGANGKPNTPGSSSGSEGSVSAQSSQEDDFLQKAWKYAQDKPEIVGGAGGGVGVGVMATVGAVVYKKCVVVSTTNH